MVCRSRPRRRRRAVVEAHEHARASEGGCRLHSTEVSGRRLTDRVSFGGGEPRCHSERLMVCRSRPRKRRAVVEAQARASEGGCRLHSTEVSGRRLTDRRVLRRRDYIFFLDEIRLTKTELRHSPFWNLKRDSDLQLRLTVFRGHLRFCAQ